LQKTEMPRFPQYPRSPKRHLYALYHPKCGILDDELHKTHILSQNISTSQMDSSKMLLLYIITLQAGRETGDLCIYLYLLTNFMNGYCLEQSLLLAFKVDCTDAIQLSFIISSR